ncbi:hypothetical protein HY989_06755 [Candidatus Micrarchaeota archaeon]|nr:hypothetical protein [Candidatus Micrarchaeota archaeon]
MEKMDLQKLLQFLEAKKIQGAYGINAKNNEGSSCEITHYIFPKFLPYVTKEMEAQEIGTHKEYEKLLLDLKESGFEFDTADAKGTFTGLARIVQKLDFALPEELIVEMKKVKGFGALVLLAKFLEEK